MKIKTTKAFEEDFKKLFSEEPKYVMYRWFEWITSDLWLDMKHLYQRGKRGYSDRDVWDMNHYLSKIIPPMLRQMISGGYCHPIGLTPKKWDNIREKIALGFEASEKEEQSKDLDKQFDEGMKLFVKYYKNLWD